MGTNFLEKILYYGIIRNINNQWKVLLIYVRIHNYLPKFFGTDYEFSILGKGDGQHEIRDYWKKH